MTDKSDGKAVNDHPSTEDVAAYLTGAMGATEKADFEAHLASCQDCRREVTSARKLLHSRSSHRHDWIIPAVAAASLAIVFLTPSQIRRGSETIRVRSTTADGSPGVQVVVPTNRQTISSAPVRFVWHPTGGDELYHVTLTDAAGAGVWTGETSDTSVVLPAAISLQSGRDYLWYVDGVRSNGTSVTSGAQSFRIAW